MDDENNALNQHNRIVDPNDGKSEDLKLISRWARKWLFHNVQFIYKPEKTCAVEPPGYVYRCFRDDLKERLVGVKLLHGSSDAEKTKYIKSLWIDVTKKKQI